ncbi:MAG: hypothetical protein GF355_17590, partial [Candidatus Eisenbacteria bacterium]|nr:hypothetical protein [Candidatus Eisenbacteria bacterium]
MWAKSSPAGAGSSSPSSTVQSSLRLRLISAVLFLPLLWFLIRWGSWPYLAFVAAVVAGGSIEWHRLLRRTGLRPWPGWTTLSALALFAAAIHHDARLLAGVLGAWIVAGLLVELFRGGRQSVVLLGGTLLGAVYLGLLPAA